LSIIGSLLVGVVGLIYANANLATELAAGEKIFMILVNAVFHPVIAGILLAAILAAIMSTADSHLLVSSSALAEDFYRQLIRPAAPPAEVLMVGRVGVIGLSIVALLLAMNPESSVLGLVSYAWAGFGAAFGPVILLSLYWKRMNRNGALVGMIVGGVTIVVWKQLTGGIFDVYEIVPGIILATISVVSVSLLTKEPEQQVIEQFNEFENNLKTFE
jgi:sodium/proline symporter